MRRNQAYKEYVNGKLEEKGGIRANIVVKTGSDASVIEATSGKYGAFVRTFENEENKKPVVILDNLKLQDVRNLAKQLDQKTFRGIVTTRRGLAIRVTRDGLAEARKNCCRTTAGTRASRT